MSLSQLFHGEKVRLTALTQEDMGPMTRWFQESDFPRLLDAVPAYPRTESHWKKWLDERHAQKDVYVFAIRTQDTNELVGWIELEGILWTHRNCWIAIAIGDPAQRGKGYGYDALCVVLDYIFNELNLHRVQLTVFEYNTAGRALYERLGFTHEGAFRQALERDGQRYDIYLYGLLRHEWRGRQPGR